MRLESSVNRVSMARPGRSGRDTRPRHSTRPRRDWFIRGTWLYLPPKAALINIFSVNLAHPSQTKPRMENDYWKSIGDWLVQLFERPFLFLPLFFSLFLLFFFISPSSPPSLFSLPLLLKRRLCIDSRNAPENVLSSVVISSNRPSEHFWFWFPLLPVVVGFPSSCSSSSASSLLFFLF